MAAGERLMHRGKIFGIGFHKTGTTSLRDALALLGYRVTGPNFNEEEELGDGLIERAAELAERYDAFQDNPWPILFREMDQRFPGSKFVLTVRDVDLWYASALRHFGAADTPRRKRIYGATAGHPAGNETIYKQRYNMHYRDVLDYFADRPDDLLVMDVTKGDGWHKLCPFLGHSIPPVPFPHSNIGNTRLLRRVARMARKRTRLLREKFGLTSA
jgi:hypothetical protein